MKKISFVLSAVVVLFLLDLVLLITIHNSWHKSMNKYIPLQKKILVKKVDIANAHTSLEEFLNGDISISVDGDIIEHFDLKSVDLYLKSIKKDFNDNDEKKIIYQIKSIKQNLKELNSLAWYRIDNIQTEKSSKLKFDQDFDKKFDQINKKLDRAISLIDKKLAKSIESKELIFKIVMMFFVPINLAVFIMIYIIETRNKTLEKNLKLERDKALTTLKSIGDGVIITDMNGNINFLNRVAQDLTGYDEGEALGKSLEMVFDIINPVTRQKVESPVKKVLQYDKTFELSEATSLINKDNKEYIISDSASPIKDDNGKTLGVVLVFKDDTEKYSLKDELERQENIMSQQSKMAAMGEMLENIAHQWRQPLSVISTSISGIKLQKDFGILQDKFLYETIELVMDSTDYLSKTIDDFRHFFTINKNKEIFEVKSAIENAIIFMSPSYQYNQIEIVSRLRDVDACGYKNELIQVLVSIMQNSKDAFEERDNDKEKKFVFIKLKKLNSDYIQIRIKDTAGGIPTKIIDRIFEPYFTTKHQSRGTGIGLYMVLQMVTKHMNGEIGVENTKFTYQGKKYKGASFTIKLPIK